VKAIEAAARASGTPVDTLRAYARHITKRHEAAKKPAATVALRERRTPGLEEGFKRLGMSAEAAGAAARGRDGRSSKTGGLIEEGQRLGLVPAAARAFARGRGIQEAATKHEDPDGGFKGGEFPPADYAYVPDREDPSTWALLLTLVPGGMPDPDSVKAAVQAIDPTNPVADNPVPDDALPDVKAALANAWTKAGLPADSLPEVLATEALRRAFMRAGLSEEAAAIAARGRDRRR